LSKKTIAIMVAVAILVGVIGFFIGFGVGSINNTTPESNVANVNETNDKKEIKEISVMEVTRSIFYAPQYVALSQGYFEEEGLKIDLTTGSGADSVMTAVLSNQVDIGFAGPEASIYVYNQGSTDYPKVFAQLTKRDGSFLVSREKNDDFKWTDVKKSVIIPGRVGGVPNMTLQYALRKNGIDIEKDVTLDTSISFDLMAGAFAGGDAEYVTLFEPTASMTEKQGAGYIVASIGEEAGDIPYTAYFAKKSYIAENEELIQNFTNAVYKGQKWVEEHSAKEIAEKVSSFFPSTDISMLESSIQRYKDIDAWNQNPILTKESFEKLQDVMQEAGELETRASYEDIVNNKYAEKAVNQ